MTDTIGPWQIADRPSLSTWNVHVAEDGGGLVLYVGGELDMATWPAMEDALTAVCSGPGQVVVVDVSLLRFMDCGGLGLLVVAHERLESEGRKGLVVSGASGVVRRMFELTRLTSLLADREPTGLGRRVPLETWRHTRDLERARRYAGLSVRDWFVAYFALGGTASFGRFGVYLSGGATHLDSHQRNIAVHALNEHLVERGLEDGVLSSASEEAVR
jgi:anti-anti-sigma factor